MIDVEQRFAELLRTIIPGVGDDVPDWDDVLRRAARVRESHPSDRSRLPMRSRRGWYALAAAALLTVLVVNPAFGIGPRVIEWFRGSPAPELVEHNLASLNEALDRLEREGTPVIAERARGVTAIETDHGWVYLWAAPMEGGGWCLYLQTPSSDEHQAYATCQDGSPETQPLLVIRSWKDYGNGMLRLLAGRADPPIGSLEVRLEDGSTQTIPLVDQFFLDDIEEGKEAVGLVARDGAGRILADKPIRFGEPSG